MSTIIVHGMQGMGDNLHQRAVVKQLLDRGDEVYLETPWPCIYHDLVGRGLKLLERASKLRTQAKNAAREAAAYTGRPAGIGALSIWYRPADVRQYGSVLAAMLASAGLDREACDFRLPLKPEWIERAAKLIDDIRPDRPIMLFRPMMDRTEWGGCKARNPDPDAYAALFRSIRERFCVVSVADLEDGKEWIVGEAMRADVEFHRGELDFGTLAALTWRSALTFCSPGFAAVLAQAMSRPAAVVFGGYEDFRSFSLGARFAPYLGIDPIASCQCFRHDHDCRKAIDLPLALARLKGFVDVFAIPAAAAA